jgi:phage tail sheath protein FI
MARLTYSAPGVYVEEVPSAQKPIAGVGTNTAAFIGIVPDEIQYPVRNDKYNPMAAAAKIDATGSSEEKINALEREKTALKTNLDTKIAGINKGEQSPADKKTAIDEATAAYRDEVKAIDNKIRLLKTPATPPEDENLKPYRLETFKVKIDPYVTKLCTNFTDYTSNFGPFSADDPEKEPGEAFSPEHRALTHAVYGFFRNGGTRCFVARVKSANSAELDKALNAIDSIDAVALVASPGLQGDDIWGKLTAHCDNAEDRFAILDSPPDVEGADGDLDITLLSYDNDKNVLPQRSKNAAFYFPWIEVMDPAKQLQDQDPARNIEMKYRGRIYVPPSGHIAGIYARTDEERGVHKAPANCAVSGAMNVKYYIGKRHQELLNPQGCNCIRNIDGNIAVWGARTIGGDQNNEWKYVNVRRVMLYLRESIDEGTQWVVFEPNDIALWGKIRRNVTAFLTNVWRSGALFGASPEEAFYVKCDAELNPPEVRDLGQVITEIGVAIVRPAEFVIFRVSQSTGVGTETA